MSAVSLIGRFWLSVTRDVLTEVLLVGIERRCWDLS